MAQSEAADLELSEEALLEAARNQTGLDDFGDDRFREGLGVLIETYEAAGLRPGGRKRTRDRLIMLLATRLRVEDSWKRYPEIREREIRRPVILTGLPRTGTSALFNLLGADPDSRPLLLWEAMNPTPLEGLAPGQEDPRLAGMKAHFERQRQENPAFDKIHRVRADGPEECVLLTAHTFCDVQLGIETLMDPYRAWFLEQDLHGTYAYYADLLRMLDFQRPGNRWLLKSPAHLWALDILTELFPDVCIIQTHRNPMQILASYCSMMEALMNTREKVDTKELGASVLEYLALKLEAGFAARDRSDPGRFFDVDYRRFVEDPLETARGIYAYFDLDLRPEVSQALQQHVRDNPQNKHGAHTYSLDEYGLSPEQVRERLSDYIERFDLPTDL